MGREGPIRMKYERCVKAGFLYRNFSLSTNTRQRRMAAVEHYAKLITQLAAQHLLAKYVDFFLQGVDVIQPTNNAHSIV